MLTRIFGATLITAAVGAIGLSIYEYFFDPQAFAAGPTWARLLFGFVWSAPLILIAFVVLGLPTALILHRVRINSAVAYAIAGSVEGALFGAILIPGNPAFGIPAVAAYGCVCALTYWWLDNRTSAASHS